MSSVQPLPEADFDVVETTIADIHAAYKAGTLSVRQLVQMYLDCIALYDKKGPAINAIISLNSGALKEADRLDVKFRRTGFMTRDNLPAGITFLGRPYADAKMIQLAYAYEQATQHRRAPTTTL